jgi:hypothetical protein
MRRLRGDAELYARTTPPELMRALYRNGFLSREQFERLRIHTRFARKSFTDSCRPALIRTLFDT